MSARPEGSIGYIPRPSQPPQCVRRNVSNYVCKLSAEYKERMSIQGVVGCIFFISTAGAKNKKKICNKDIQALFQTSCNIKWIDDTKLYVLVKEVAGFGRPPIFHIPFSSQVSPSLSPSFPFSV
eukprot:675204-Hanusia_phi.AAC.15